MISAAKLMLVAAAIGTGIFGWQRTEVHQGERQLAEMTRISTGALQQIAPAASTSRSAPDSGSARSIALGRDLHKALRLVGCYHGDISSPWGEASKQAMRAFNAEVGSSLAGEVPSHILLTMVQGFGGRACQESRKEPAVAATLPVEARSDAPTELPRETTVSASVLTPVPEQNSSKTIETVTRKRAGNQTHAKATRVARELRTDAADMSNRYRTPSARDVASKRRSDPEKFELAARKRLVPAPTTVATSSTGKFDGKVFFARLDRS